MDFILFYLNFVFSGIMFCARATLRISQTPLCCYDAFVCRIIALSLADDSDELISEATAVKICFNPFLLRYPIGTQYIQHH